MRINNGVNAMPRYFFHVREGSALHRDTEGQELPDAEAARREAISSGREMLGEKLLHGGALDSRTIEIADETGHVVDVVNVQRRAVPGRASFAPIPTTSPSRRR